MRLPALLLVLPLLAACQPRPERAASAGLPWYQQADEGCGFLAVPRTQSPESLVAEYLRRDGAGDFLGPHPWQDSALTCAGHLPGWDVSAVIAGYTQGPPRTAGDTTRIPVRYQVLGDLSSDSAYQPVFTAHRDSEDVTFIVIQTPHGVRIDGPQLNQHLLLPTVRTHWATKDTAFLAEVERVARRGTSN
jgi:hypothetical protein